MRSENNGPETIYFAVPSTMYHGLFSVPNSHMPYCYGAKVMGSQTVVRAL